MGTSLKGKELGKGLSQRKDGRYSARYTNTEGKRVEIYDFNLNNLRKRLNDAVYEDGHNIYGAGDRITVDEWFDKWMKLYKTDLRDNTVRSYRHMYRHISKSIGGMYLANVKRIHILEVMSDLRSTGLSTGTINLAYIIIHSLFEQARLDSLIQADPTEGTRVRRTDSKERRVMTVEEQRIFVKYIKKSQYYILLQTLLMTGLRIGEIQGLCWNDIDFETKDISIRRNMLYSKDENGKYHYYFGEPKTKSGYRNIPVKDELIELLKLQRKHQRKLTKKYEQFKELVFTSKTGYPVSAANVREAIRTIVSIINRDEMEIAEKENRVPVYFEHISPHALRRTFATRAFECDIPPKTVQALLGHSSIDVTMDIYVHVMDEKKKLDIERMSVII